MKHDYHCCILFRRKLYPSDVAYLEDTLHCACLKTCVALTRFLVNKPTLRRHICMLKLEKRRRKGGGATNLLKYRLVILSDVL